MRLDRVLAFIALLAVGLAFGDEPDWTIYVPDSLSGLMYSQCAAYNPVTDKVYVGGTGNCVIVIDCATNTKVARIPTKSDCSAIFCSPVNGKVYCVGDLLTVIDGVSDTVVKTLHASGSAFCYNSRNQRLYAGLGSTSVIDTRTDSMVATIDAGASSLCYNPHDDKVYYKSNGHVEDRNYVMILNGKDLSFIRTVPAKSGPGTLCYNSANNKVYCADYGSKTVMVIDGTTDKVLTTIAADSGLADMCCNPRDNKIYLANGAHAPRGEESDMIGPGWHAHPYHDYGDSTVTVIDGATDKVRTAISTHGRPMLLSYDSASNKVLAATDGGSFGTSLESLLTLPKPGQVLPLHSSGRHVETNRGPGVDIIDGTSNQLTASATLSQHSSAFCFDSQRGYAYCVISDRDHSGAAVLDVATGQVLADPPMGRSLAHFATTRTTTGYTAPFLRIAN